MMPRLPLRRSLALSVCLLAEALTPKAAQAEEQISWEPVDGAAYYEGSAIVGGERTRFRTTATWLILPEGSAVRLRAMDAQGQALGTVETTVKGQVPPPAAAVAPAPPPPPAPEVAPAPPPAPEVAPAPPPTPSPEPTEETPEQAPAPPAPPAAAPAAAPQSEEVIPTRRGRASVSIAIGKEWLTAAGGVSAYRGSSNLGGTAIRAETPAQRWYGSAAVEAHNYNTITSVSTTGSDTATQEESKFLRLAVRAGGFYDFGAGTGSEHRLAVGAGLAYLKIPTLVVDDQTTGAAQLQEQSAILPFIGLTYERYLSEEHALGLEIVEQPLAFGGTKVSGTEGFAYWRIAFVERLYMELGLDGAKTRAVHSADCPAIAGCAKDGTASSSLFQARMGLGMRF